MKSIVVCSTALLVMAAMQSCQSNARYVDLNDGKALNLVKDEQTGLMVDEETDKPVSIYVDTYKGDTIDGRTGKVINGKVVKNEAGTYVYRSSGGDYSSDGENNGGSTASGNLKIKQTGDERKIKSADYKKEVEKDGDITIKSGDKKIKIDGETGERKVKIDD